MRWSKSTVAPPSSSHGRPATCCSYDNMLTAHARNPFVGPRKILVAMGDMISRKVTEAQIKMNTLDCIVIGYNEVPFQHYESFLHNYGENSEAYRDLKFSFVTWAA